MEVRLSDFTGYEEDLKLKKSSRKFKLGILKARRHSSNQLSENKFIQNFKICSQSQRDSIKNVRFLTSNQDK